MNFQFCCCSFVRSRAVLILKLKFNVVFSRANKERVCDLCMTSSNIVAALLDLTRNSVALLFKFFEYLRDQSQS